MRNSLQQQSGFTLVELLVVITIIVILTGAGGGIYSKYRQFERVRSVTVQVEGLIMEAQSLANASQDSRVLGYMIRIDDDKAQMYRLKLVENDEVDINDIEPGTVEDTDWYLESIDEKKVEFGRWVKVAFLGFVGGENNSFSSLTAVVPSGRILFGNREPGLRQQSTSPENNLYNPLAKSSWGGQRNIGQIKLKLDHTTDNFSRTIRVYGESGRVEVLGD